jgi:hypothetical protein
MSDRREEILSRLLEVCRAVEGITTAIRNQDSISETSLPALILIDAGEVANESDPKIRPANAPRRVTMTPEIRILLQDYPEGVGSGLNLYRSRLIKAVLTDSTLLALTTEGQGARYEGAVSELRAGRSMTGDMLCAFSFTYYLKPNDLP